MSISNSEKESIVTRILKSKTFSRSETLRDLLKYLLQAQFSEKEVKAIHIAIDLLHRKGELDENDETIARVYIHKLRSKLKAYYANEGKDDGVVIEIPKGKYTLCFTKREEKTVAPKKSNYLRSIIISFIVLVLINSAVLWQLGLFSAKNTNPVWNEFTTAKEPIHLILANPFFYTAQNGEATFVVRSFDINSDKDLRNAGNAFPDDRYELNPSDLSYFGNNNITALPMLFSVIAKSDNEIKLYSGLDFNLERVTNHNSIAITSHKSIGFFNEFLNQSSFEISEAGVLFLNLHEEKVKYLAPKISNDYYHDYALFIKIPTPKGKTLCLLSDYHSIGNKGLMELITSKDVEKLILEQTESDLSKLPDYFELLVKVSGYQEENLNAEIIHFKALQ